MGHKQQFELLKDLTTAHWNPFCNGIVGTIVCYRHRCSGVVRMRARTIVALVGR